MLDSITVVDALEQPQVLVFAKFQDHPLDESVAKRDATGQLGAAVARKEFSGAVGSLVEAFVPLAPAGKKDKGGKHGKHEGEAAAEATIVRAIVLGLGKKDKFKTGDLRNAAAALGRRLSATKESSVSVQVAPVLEGASKELDLRHAGRAFGEGLGLLTWNHQQFKGKATEKAARPALTVAVKGKGFAKGFEQGLALAEATNLARTLSETPPNIATPAFIAQQAKDLGKKLGLSVTVFQGKDLETEKLAGHLNVGKASENKPCMVRLAYAPEKPRKKAKALVLIGKTMCYDSGGLSLKINNGMVGMKRDKDGGCAVLGAMHAIAAVIQPDFPVVAYLCCAENSISEQAYRPDDIITYRNGVTCEITNTDAEGRLVLADALAYASEKDDPAAIVDLATLTGGVVVALGSTFCGMFCEDDALRAKVEAAGVSAGEPVWRLPLNAEYKDMMKSPVADILNSNPNRKAHPIQGAAFLAYFVDEKIPWCHLDIAGVHATESDSGPFVKGPTGWGVRILADLVSNF